LKKLIIIPAYNEAANLPSLINQVETDCRDYDYVIINDCSTDNTINICKDYGFNAVHLPINLGIGGAMQTGYLYAKLGNYDLAVQVDGDGQHIPNYIHMLENNLLDSGSNIVIGSRFLGEESFKSSQMRRYGIQFLSILMHAITKTRISDPTSGFRMIDAKTINLFSKYYPQDYPEPETIVYLLKNGYRLKETSVQMLPRQSGKSSINWFRSIYYMIKVSLAILLEAFIPREY